jgi:hypothetical protein
MRPRDAVEVQTVSLGIVNGAANLMMRKISKVDAARRDYVY